MQANPYQAPTADLAAPAAGVFDESSPFSPQGRFGRLSYLAWGMTLGVLAWVVMAVVFALTFAAGGEEGPGAAVMLAPLLVTLVVVGPAIIFAIRRLHDFGTSGWWVLLFLVPLVGAIFALVLLFRPGDAEPNRFAPPRRTRGWEKVVAYIGIGFMVLGLVGIIAAIAIPMLASA
jgi:uncharacterized membrane protein YhaH (DUF805 family)